MSKRENVLVVVNPSHGIHPALERAIINAQIREESEQSKLFILIMTETEALANPDQQNSVRRIDWLDKLKEKINDADIEYQIDLCWNSDWSKSVLDAVEKYDCDLTMVPFYGKAHDCVLSNSNWHLLRNSKTPILMVRPGTDSSRNKIVAAIKTQDPSYSDINQRVLERAKWSAERYKAKLHVINSHTASEQAPDRDQIMRVTGLPTAQVHIKKGSPSDVIPALSAEINADMLVIGNKRRTGINDALRGKTVEKMIEDISQDIMMLL